MRNAIETLRNAITTARNMIETHEMAEALRRQEFYRIVPAVRKG